MPNIDKIIILDRDGVINHDSDNFIKSPKEWLPIDNSLQAMGQLTSAGYSIYILTNQSGLARGYFTEQMLHKIHDKMITAAKQYGSNIAHIFYCPHGPDDNCACRKPKAGLYQQLVSSFTRDANPDFDFSKVYSVGDSIRDLIAAKTAGAKPVLVRTGKGRYSEEQLGKHDLSNTPVFDDLASFTEQLLTNRNN